MCQGSTKTNWGKLGSKTDMWLNSHHTGLSGNNTKKAVTMSKLVIYLASDEMQYWRNAARGNVKKHTLFWPKNNQG